MKRHRWIYFVSCIGMLAMSSPTLAAIAPGVTAGLERTAAQSEAQARTTLAYWTPERMAAAKAMPVPTVVVDEATLNNPPTPQTITEAPGFVPSCRPGSIHCDTRPRLLSALTEANAEAVAFGDLITPMHGTKPTNPLAGPYGPFQRWREAEPITAFPKSTVGKLFFVLNGDNFVCSGSVIGRSTVLTAGHCSSDGTNTLATNQLFCPSYLNGVNPSIGCWAVVKTTVATRWHTLGDQDFDYSCLVTNVTGTVKAMKIGLVTGTLGRAFNFAPSQAERTFGYPKDLPFNGNTLQTTASTEWYTHDFVPGLQVSKVIGSDLTGGASGGPWILGWTGGLPETADSDGSSNTDPGNNTVNGVNSHKRCLDNCNTPPTNINGVFREEMSSPPFMNTAAIGESEDVITSCLAHVNNN